MQKAAAAVANMAWHSEALRMTLCKVVGLLEALERPLKVSLFIGLYREAATFG